MRELTDIERLNLESDDRLWAQLANRTFKQTNEGGRYTCGECGRRFSGSSYFDAHRPHTSNGPCLDPAAVGMVQDTHKVWFDSIKRAAFPTGGKRRRAPKRAMNVESA
jgi:hypothetical protein